MTESLVTTFETSRFDPCVTDVHYLFPAYLKQRGKLELAESFIPKPSELKFQN